MKSWDWEMGKAEPDPIKTERDGKTPRYWISLIHYSKNGAELDGPGVIQIDLAIELATWKPPLAIATLGKWARQSPSQTPNFALSRPGFCGLISDGFIAHQASSSTADGVVIDPHAHELAALLTSWAGRCRRVLQATSA